MSHVCFFSGFSIAFALIVACLPTQAGEYESVKNQFRISFDSNWKKVASPDVTIEIALVPATNSISRTAFLSIGAEYDTRFKNVNPEQYVKIITGEAMTKGVKSSVSNFKLIREGETSLGKVPAYEALMSYETAAGKRYRRTIMTMRNGFTYNVSFHSTPEGFDADYEAVKKVLNTFRFSR